MSLHYLKFGSADYLYLQIKDFLRNNRFIHNKPNRDALYDDSLRVALSEFQGYKRLAVADGTLTTETFQAFGEEMNNHYLTVILRTHPELRSLFLGTKGNESQHKPALQAEEIIVGLNIVYEKDYFNEARVRETFGETIQDLKDIFKEIKIEFNIILTPGAGAEYDRTTGYYNKIATGAREGIINVFLFRNEKDYKYMSFNSFPAAQIMFSKGNTLNDKFSKGQLAHEVGHLLLAFAGDGLSDSIFGLRIFNAKQDWTEIDPANSWMRNGFAEYGRDWVDDYRIAYEQIDAQDGAIWVRRAPTVLDLYRLGAKLIAAQTK